MNDKTLPVKLGPHLIGGHNPFVVISGPCSIESREQFLKIASQVKKSGAIALRGGMFKLRRSPKTFQGMGKDAFSIVQEVKKITGLAFFSEVTDPREINDMMDLVDVFQVGSRNMHNYSLLKELGQIRKPILLKRGFAALIKEWLLAADYIIKGGNDQVILCERGIRTFETSTRNTFDLNAIAYVKQYASFPVIADPSHATGDSRLVIPMSLAAAAAGADGLLIETHYAPEEALSDGFQAIDFSQIDQLMDQLERLLSALGRRLAKSV
ncbi:MAG: 3-deoxy-7-phosphoheptulonate synthase [Bdellovibrionales bacterium]|nr:3-deoxy-7-phosphoheptulonate synthase [Bdellovibrionales bacterium]